ncbi:dienelactone hydrolase family protein [Tundrisphaera lichenicola]|uniref:dienelactone hydrolase family protein n=1 Tax=Tundrisphaera lichenicola TaxID=2029860 RepID=UPI003EBC564C
MRTYSSAIGLGLVMILGGAARGEIVESTGSFTSLGKTIHIERFEPAEPGKYPAIVVLHGAGGMEVGGPEFRIFSRELARRGYVAQLVHYFDQTGTERADLSVILKSFSAWMVTIGDAITLLQHQEIVDPGRIGLLGFSLGSYLSLSVASRDSRVSAVVEYFGGLPELFARNLQRFPPTLILHGEADEIVPVSEARKLEKILSDKEFPFEIRVYPGQGHGFRGEPNVDAYQRSIAFFDKHVKKAKGPS